MASGEKAIKAKSYTNEHCVHFFAENRCRKVMRRCSNKSGFYTECPIYNGNCSLGLFL